MALHSDELLYVLRSARASSRFYVSCHLAIFGKTLVGSNKPGVCRQSRASSAVAKVRDPEGRAARLPALRSDDAAQERNAGDVQKQWIGHSSLMTTDCYSDSVRNWTIAGTWRAGWPGAYRWTHLASLNPSGSQGET